MLVQTLTDARGSGVKQVLDLSRDRGGEPSPSVSPAATGPHEVNGGESSRSSSPLVVAADGSIDFSGSKPPSEDGREVSPPFSRSLSAQNPPSFPPPPPPPGALRPLLPMPLLNMNSADGGQQRNHSPSADNRVNAINNMQRLQRLIRANQALALSKVHAAAAAAVTRSSPVSAPPPPPPSRLSQAGACLFPPMSMAAAVASIAPPPPALPPPPPPPPMTSTLDLTPGQPTELQRVNQESLQQYNHFRENMLRQFTLAKMKRRRRSLSPTANLTGSIAAMSTSEDERSVATAPTTSASSSSPCSPASSLDNSTSSPEAAAAAASATGSRQLAGKRKRDEIKDEAYWERRKKNNEAAKRSRDARRAKEDEIAIRAAFLEQENIQLKWEVASLKTETCRLKALLLNDAALERIATAETSLPPPVGSLAASVAAPSTLGQDVRLRQQPHAHHLRH